MKFEEEKYELTQALNGIVSIDMLPVPAMIADIQADRLNNLYINKKFTEILGYTAEDIHSLDEWFSKAYPDEKYRQYIKTAWNDAIARYGQKHEVSPTSRIKIRCADGQDKWFQFHTSIKGSVFYNVFIDVHDSEENSDPLSETRLLQSNLLSVISHDLRSPYNTILGLVSLIKREGLNGPMAEYVKLLEKTTMNGLLLIEDLLQISMMQKNLGDSISKNVLIKKFLIEILEKNKPLLRQKGQKVFIKCEDSLQANIDNIKTGLILDNLLNNAIKYSYPGQVIWLKCTMENNRLQLIIKDQGQGFDQKDLQSVFKKFGKLSARPTSGERSTGLGLYICKILADLLGGSISARSDGKDKGCSMTLDLPVI
ncbi:MAG: PAS domain-containing sensor histidine kinase [Cyclobacteriaceae bacterium]|nr:PAS domain-containing sensor histidine kinase [Cyclobacteriaceae bacterium]